MQGIGSPCKLPRAEVGLPALFVQIGEYQEEQQRNYARQHDCADDDTIHEAMAYRLSGFLMGEDHDYGFIGLDVKQLF